jgi:endonuclease/exonuclease/phosphatase family metal-dependent hydrolase
LTVQIDISPSGRKIDRAVSLSWSRLEPLIGVVTLRDCISDQKRHLATTCSRGPIFGQGTGIRRPAGQRLVLLVAALLTASAHAQVRVMNWNVAKLNGDPVAVEDVFAAAAADDQPGFTVAPAIIVLQEVTASSMLAIENIIQAGIPSVEYATAIFTVGSSENGSGGAQMLLYRTDLFAEVARGHRDIPTGAGRNTDRWQLRLNGSNDDAGVIWVYGGHLKASNSSADAETRRQGAEAIRADADSLPNGSNIIYAGDFNLYSNNEPAYAEFLSSGSGRANDPYGTGSWGGSGNAIKHTQSPRLGGGSLVGGGMDDRFDFQLFTDSMLETDSFSFMAGTCRSLGNDGNHYDIAINTGTNSYYPGQISRSNLLADALFDASDHIPVMTDFRIPGLLSCVLADSLGRVVSGGSESVTLLVANGRVVATPDASSPLEYVATGDGVLIGGGSGLAPLLPSFDSQIFSLVEGMTGEFTAVVEVEATSGGVSQPSYELQTSGFAVRPAVPSWSDASIVVDQVVQAEASADSGVLFIDVPVHNLGWDAMQSSLDLDAASGLRNGFFLWEGLGSVVAGRPGILRFGFNTDGADEGEYVADITIQATDEDIPGETTHYLMVRLETTVGGGRAVPGDFNGDGFVNGADLGLLLGAWGQCAKCPEDLDGSGGVNGADLGLLLGYWTG